MQPKRLLASPTNGIRTVDDCAPSIHSLLQAKHRAVLANPPCKPTCPVPTAETHRALRAMEDDWWAQSAPEIQPGRRGQCIGGLRCHRNPLRPIETIHPLSEVRRGRPPHQGQARYPREMDRANPTKLQVLNSALPDFPPALRLLSPLQFSEVFQATQGLRNMF